MIPLSIISSTNTADFKSKLGIASYSQLCSLEDDFASCFSRLLSLEVEIIRSQAADYISICAADQNEVTRPTVIVLPVESSKTEALFLLLSKWL